MRNFGKTGSSESFSLAMTVCQKQWNSFYLLLVTLIMDLWTRFQCTWSIALWYWVSSTADALPSQGSYDKLLLVDKLVVITHNYTLWIITITKGDFAKFPVWFAFAKSMNRISERRSYFLLKRFYSQQLNLSPLRSATYQVFLSRRRWVCLHK